MKFSFTIYYLRIFIFLNILFIGLSFPLQVMLNNAYIYLIPIILTMVLFINLKKNITNIKFDFTDLLILILTIEISLNSIAQFLISNLDVSKFINLLTFFVSIQFYIYFKFYAKERSLQYFKFAVLFIGIIAAIFFIYDSYYKFYLFEPSNFSKLATEYQNLRAGNEEVTSRSLIDYRSAGLLDKAPLSAAYVSFALFISLSESKYNPRLIYILLSLFLSFSLLLSLNFSAILCAILSIFLINYRMLSLAFLKINYKLIIIPVLLIISLIIIVFLLLITIETDLLKNLLETYNAFIFSSSSNEPTLFSRLTEEINVIFTNQSNIISFLFGDGYPGNYYNNYIKGGDFGFIDNIIGMGFFLYIFFIFVIFKNSMVNFRKINRTGNYLYTNIAILILFFVLLMDSHYSILFFKSITPIFFIALGILSKETNKLSINKKNQ
jgi:hypothetical protein